MESELYHHQLLKLQNCILELEKGDISFSEALQKYDDGLKFKSQCQQTLQDLQESLLLLQETSSTPIQMTIDDIFKNLEELSHQISHSHSLEDNIEKYQEAQKLWQSGERILQQYAIELTELEAPALLSIETNSQTFGDD